ncbi:antimicrobial peptide ABC transporter ATP-binding protein [Secundilactobacillus pentosiphilus]|uniref:Antimicrobial peptide ABC transporter ATP-binding protein n=1 Tax=Secundilactobacillus pentosiphilus TaxID=1714682 RepID=A0A1Z5IMN4_9LACO|nr:ABC transporter ATP-binding protein [Secundilactobacillus pentosiphilus]GAX02822.1 antimicrobial peptide ABC transporter ATP-binding protein [Secundilactobacillus pentosiphilus]
MPILELNNVAKTYHTRFNANAVNALTDISLSVEAGEYVAIMGESGSGKSTLLNLIAALDKPTAGSINLNGTELSTIPENQSAKFRREHLGFVFQDFNLLDTFNVKDNIVLPLVLSKTPVVEMEKRVKKLAPQLGLADKLEKFPYELSGGQQQRVAAARALITDPELLLADEPTGALDSHTADELLKLFAELNAEGQTILMVTHSAVAASHAQRVLFIRDGRLFHQLYRGDLTQDEMLIKISDTMTAMLAKQDENNQSDRPSSAAATQKEAE